MRKEWNELRWKVSWSPVVDGLGEGSEFYFVDTRASWESIKSGKEHVQITV